MKNNTMQNNIVQPSIIQPCKRKRINCYEAEKVMEKALDVGEAMLRSGGEILRVEDTIMRICQAYGDGIVDVFTILSLIIVSWHTTDDKNFTQTRRIYSYSTDLGRLEELNALSRYICANQPSCDEIEQRVEEIMEKRSSSRRFECMGNLLGAGGFAIFFGGTMRDGVASALVAMALYFWSAIYSKKSNNAVVYTFISSVFVSTLCLFSVWLGIGQNADKVMIGTIMLLIPGINMMNALRDMITNDIITGTLKLIESLMAAVAIAAGFAVPILIAQKIMLFL